MNKVQDTNLICAPVISQLLALESLKLGRRAIEPELQSLASVRHKVHESLAALDGLASFPRTQGAFYVVLRLPGVSDPHAFIRAMVERHRVAVIPGFAFGLTDTREANYQRLSFGSLDPATVAEGVQRFIAAVRDWYGR
jgi:aspartate/methionine/tyrosine aminotransferase